MYGRNILVHSDTKSFFESPGAALEGGLRVPTSTVGTCPAMATESLAYWFPS